MIKSIIHFNVVVTDLERSLKFYRDLLGGQVTGVSRASGKGAAIALGLGETAEWDGCFVRFGDDERATLIDLLQWINPPSTGKPYDKLNNVGIPRMALRADDIDKMYDDLKSKGVEFLSAPQIVQLTPETPDTGLIKIVVCRDPDGTAVELVEFLKPQKKT